ncbi:MAG TPA: hypothetical protein VMF52_08890 [Steroidobacteraceae bacterium]|nr:hypothetical protein [Steroidobacteraceae bacterium]
MNTLRNASLTLAVGVALGGATAARADALWEFTPTIEAGYLYDDNYRLTQPGTEISVNGPLLDAALEMRTLTQTGEFSFAPRVRATYFADEPDLDSVDYFGTMDWQRNGQRVNTRLRADFAEQDVINSERPDAGIDTGLGEPVFGDAGRILVKNRRTRYGVRPSVNWEINQRNQFEIDASYADVSFDRAITDAQVGFDMSEITAGVRTRINERTTISTKLRGGYYDIQFRDVTTAYGAELQWDTRTARDTRTFFRVGAQNVELPDGDNNVAWLAGAGVSLLLGRNELFTDISRSVGPSSAGVVVARDQLRLRLVRTMTPRLNLVVGVRGTHDDDVDDTSTYVPRSYATADFGVEWRWQEEWSVRLAGDYTWQKFDNPGGATDADSTGVMASVIYQPLQRSRARND